MTDYLELEKAVIAVTAQAAALVRQTDFQIHQKADVVDIVTSSDLLVQHFLQEKLAALLPGSGFYCEEENEAEYRKTVELDYETNYGKTRKDFATEELYQSALKNYEERMKLGSGETYFSDKVYFNLSIDGVIDMMNIVNKADNK